MESAENNEQLPLLTHPSIYGSVKWMWWVPTTILLLQAASGQSENGFGGVFLGLEMHVHILPNKKNKMHVHRSGLRAQMLLPFLCHSAYGLGEISKGNFLLRILYIRIYRHSYTAMSNKIIFFFFFQFSLQNLYGQSVLKRNEQNAFFCFIHLSIFKESFTF